MEKKQLPDYKKIYTDLIINKFPDKKVVCEALLAKKELSHLDVIELNQIIFREKEDFSNSKHKSYNKSSIMNILNYQKMKGLNNTQTALHFKLSRNSVSKWKKLFI